MTKIREFIDNNNITFNEGERNASVVVLVGYSQHLKVEEVDLRKELFDEIEEDSFIKDEIKRLWSYCKKNKYSAFWKKKEAKDLYKF